LAKRLDSLKAVTQSVWIWLSRDRTYDKLVARVHIKITRIESLALACLRTSDASGLQTYIENLRLLVSLVRKHVPSVVEVLEGIQSDTRIRFQELTNQAIKTLNSGDFTGFENSFAEIRLYVLNVVFILEDHNLMKNFRLVNQLLFESVRTLVQTLLSMLEIQCTKVDYLAVRAAIQDTRAVGDFVADHCTLFHAEMATAKHLTEDPWLSKILALSKTHFSSGRDFRNLAHCAILGVVPSADVKEIRRAFNAKALVYHPDKVAMKGPDTNAIFIRIKEAEEVLVEAASSRVSNSKRAFDQEVRQIRLHIVNRAKEYLQEQRYDAIDQLLSGIPGLREIKDLIEPQFDDDATRTEVYELIKAHVNTAKIEVRTLWSEKKYRDLNDTIDDLKAMEQSLKPHSEVFPASWNEGILEDIESETKKLGRECRSYLSSQVSSKEYETEFRRGFLQLGGILFELPSMKSSTKAIMGDVLEFCLREEWGFGYLFELGLSLQRGDDTTDETAHVAHLILAEFSHFKEVLTMAWNTETVQKPVEDTVAYIRAETLDTSPQRLKLDEGELLASFAVFESEYNTFLGDFIRPESDRSELVNKVQEIGSTIRQNCGVDRWGQDIRDAIPQLLGGIFALFTICKSGESFNRIEATHESSELGKQILLKPHNIQILTLLYMFGCHEHSKNSLESQLLQIRTGEGKSMILGAAATVLGLLGFRVRCVCYSEYLSKRDHDAFLQIFREFGLEDDIMYSQITKMCEDTVTQKGDIRLLTKDLLLQRLGGSDDVSSAFGTGMKKHMTLTSVGPKQDGNEEPVSTVKTRPIGGHIVTKSDLSTPSSTGRLLSNRNAIPLPKEEILLVDEVDVFFGSDFYGQTYNQVTQIREPEVRQILELIWTSFKGGRRLHLSDIKKTAAYMTLVAKMKPFATVVDNEISLILDAVRRVDDEPYFLDSKDRIGYRVLDTVSYTVTMGYRTVFAYLKENDRGKLNDSQTALNEALCMQISCGQFSYANVSPSRILGVSGTLAAMGTYEKSVLQKYGISRFVFLPSVYGQSNFQFDTVGDGVCIEANKSDLNHRLQKEILRATSANRAVIVFFAGGNEVTEFENSANYRQLGRKRSILSEDMDAAKKDFIVKKASTAGQITICSAVFGRGTDFFCKDQKVEENGGVHVIQTFLSTSLSEEVQIQGRTARQGKTGTYQMILLESDLQGQFGIHGFKDTFPKKDWYKELCRIRTSAYEDHCRELESNLADATNRDKNTHKYFDALLAYDESRAGNLFKDLYSSMKKSVMPSNIDIDLCFVLDMTGSMRRYAISTKETIDSLLLGNKSIMTRLGGAFPDIEFKLRIGAMSFRDLEDGNEQFHEKIYADGGHFTDNAIDATYTVSDLTNDPSGGHDLAEDIFGAVHRCADWTSWSATAIKFMIIMTDAPAHGHVPSSAVYLGDADKFPNVHPNGHTAATVADALIRNGIDLAFCSFNPIASELTEEALAKHYLEHESNVNLREVIRIPMVSTQQGASPTFGDRNQHIIFVLDDSGSMSHNWAGVVAAYRSFCSHRMDYQCSSDLVSVVQFDSTAIVSVNQENISSAPGNLSYRGGGTYYTPAAQNAEALVLQTPPTHEPVVIFMSDGWADETDAINTAHIFYQLNVEVRRRWGVDMELHVIAFGSGLDTRQLAGIARSSAQGRIHSSANVSQLGDIFVEIATTSSNVASALESEIGRRISDAVSDKISLEYLG